MLDINLTIKSIMIISDLFLQKNTVTTSKISQSLKECWEPWAWKYLENHYQCYWRPMADVMNEENQNQNIIIWGIQSLSTLQGLDQNLVNQEKRWGKFWENQKYTFKPTFISAENSVTLRKIKVLNNNNNTTGESYNATRKSSDLWKKVNKTLEHSSSKLESQKDPWKELSTLIIEERFKAEERKEILGEEWRKISRIFDRSSNFSNTFLWKEGWDNSIL